MNIAIKNSSLNESTIIWAVTCSILLHILFFVVVPNFKFDVTKKIPDRLTVEIVNPKPLEAAVIPEPPKPVEKIKPAPERIKTLPKKELKPEPTAVQNIKPESEPTQAEPTPPAVISEAPKSDAPSEIKVPPPPPELPRKTEPNDSEVNAARDAYTQNVQSELRRNIRYPKIAESRGIQGEVKVKITIDKEGNVSNVTVLETSGNTSLDEGAIATVKRSNLKQFYPEILHGRSYELTTPIVFKIIDP